MQSRYFERPRCSSHSIGEVQLSNDRDSRLYRPESITLGGPCNLQRLTVRSFNATRDLLETSVSAFTPRRKNEAQDRRGLQGQFLGLWLKQALGRVKAEGTDIARCTTSRLKDGFGIHGELLSKTYVTTTISDELQERPKDLVKERFTAPAPHRCCVVDITYVKTRAG